MAGSYICDRFQLSETGYMADVGVHFGRGWYWAAPDENARGVISVHVSLDIMGKTRNKIFNDVLYGVPNELASYLIGHPNGDNVVNDVSISYMSGNRCRRQFDLVFNGGRMTDEVLINQIRAEEMERRYDFRAVQIISSNVSQQITVYHDNGLFTRKALDDFRRWIVYQLYDLLNEAHIIQER